VVFLNTRSNGEFVNGFHVVLNFPFSPPNSKYNIKVLPVHSAYSDDITILSQYFNFGRGAKCDEGNRISPLQTRPHWPRSNNGYQRFFSGGKPASRDLDLSHPSVVAVQLPTPSLYSLWRVME